MNRITSYNAINFVRELTLAVGDKPSLKGVGSKLNPLPETLVASVFPGDQNWL